MDKELSSKAFILSHFSILFISLIFLGGMYFILNQDFKKTENFPYITVTKPNLSFELTIKNVEDEVVVFDKTLVISGKSSPNKPVIITNIQTTDDKIENYYATETDKKGDFTKTIDLASGLNELTIASFDNQGNSKTVTRTVFYSEEKI